MSIQPSNVVAESTLQITTDRQLTVPSAPILKKSAPGDQQSPASKIIEGQANTAKRVYLMKINGDTSLADSLRRDSLRRVLLKAKKPKP